MFFKIVRGIAALVILITGLGAFITAAIGYELPEEEVQSQEAQVQSGEQAPQESQPEKSLNMPNFLQKARERIAQSKRAQNTEPTPSREKAARSNNTEQTQSEEKARHSSRSERTERTKSTEQTKSTKSTKRTKNTQESRPVRSLEPELVETDGLGISRIIMAGGIEDREPVNTSATFESSKNGRIYAYLEVSNPEQAKTELSLTWVATDGPDRELSRVSLDVGPHKRWRTWAFTRQVKSPGHYMAVVRDDQNRIIAKAPFVITQ